MTAPARLVYRPEIDGLRCIAVTSVILYHLGTGLAPGGYVGVDIFFVISGFLISSILMHEMAAGQFSFLGFYDRRIRRIFPALFLVLGVSTGVALAALTPGQLRDYGQSLAATVSFLSNIYFRLKSGYFNAAADETPLLHMWSLSVEEQFYIVFPVILLALHRWAPRRLVQSVWAMLVVSLLYSIHRQADDPVANFFYPHTRAWELAAGAVVALQATAVQLWPQWARRLGEIIGAALMLVPIFLYTKNTSFPGLSALPPVAGTALLILTMHSRSIVGRVLASSPMVGVGLISYSAYLWHQPLFAFARIATVGQLTAVSTWGLVGLTFLLAYLSWRFVERPFRSRQNFSRRTIFALAACVTVPSFAIGMASHWSHGFPARYDAATRAVAATTAPSPKRDQCHTEGVNYRHPDQACRYFGQTVDWASFGDSHSIETGYALAGALAPSGHGLVHLSFSGCQPALTFKSDDPGCSAWVRETSDWLVRHHEIKNVLMAFRYTWAIEGDQLHRYPAVPDDHPNFMLAASTAEARAAYLASFAALVHKLRGAGKTLYILRPIPELPEHIDRFVFHHANGRSGVTRAWYMARNRRVLGELNELARDPGIHLLDPSDAVCDAQRCAAIIDGQAMYFDDNHFSLAGARRFVAMERQRGALP